MASATGERAVWDSVVEKAMAQVKGANGAEERNESENNFFVIHWFDVDAQCGAITILR